MKNTKSFVLAILLFSLGACSANTTFNASEVIREERATLLLQTYGNEWTGTRSIKIVEINGKVVEEPLSFGKVEFLPGEYTFKFEGVGSIGMAEGMVVGLVGGTSAIYGLQGGKSKNLEDYKITVRMKAGYIYLLDHNLNRDGTYSLFVREI